MEDFTSVEKHGYLDSTSPISEPPDIRNWFSSYVYESPPLCSSVNEIENEVDLVNKVNLGVTVPNKDHKPMYKKMKQIPDSDLYDSLPSAPPDIGNWFSSYVYESPMLDTSDGLELSVPGESECIKETEADKETTKIDHKLVSSVRVKDFSESLSAISEPPDLRNWFSDYEYQSPQLSDTHEFGFSSFEKDQLIIDESDTEDEYSTGIFQKTMSKQETIAHGRLNSNDYKENIAAVTAKEVSSDNACSDQEMENQLSVGLPNPSEKEVYQESSFKPETLICEPKEEARFSPGVSWYNPKRKSPSKNEASFHEQRPKHIQETIFVNSNRQNSPIDQESDDKENVHRQSTETGFVTLKKARFREARDRCSMAKPNTGVLMECSRSKGLKKIAGEEEKEEGNKKRRRVLGEMSNHQSSRAEEIAGKWRCPQKNKRNYIPFVPPLKQLRLDAWIHKV